MGKWKSGTIISLSIALLFLVGLVYTLLNPSILGFVTYAESDYVSVSLNELMTETSRYSFPETVSSVRVSGTVNGSGSFSFILTNGTNNWTVYSSDESQVANRVTGFVVAQRDGTPVEVVEELPEELPEVVVEDVDDVSEDIEDRSEDIEEVSQIIVEGIPEAPVLSPEETPEAETSEDTSQTLPEESPEEVPDDTFEDDVDELLEEPLVPEINDSLPVILPGEENDSNNSSDLNETIETSDVDVNVSSNFTTNQTSTLNSSENVMLVNTTLENTTLENDSIEVNLTLPSTNFSSDNLTSANLSSDNLSSDTISSPELFDNASLLNETNSSSLLPPAVPEAPVEEITPTPLPQEQLITLPRSFTFVCVETCTLPELHNAQLLFSSDGNVTVVLEEVHYVPFIPLAQTRNISNVTLRQNQSLQFNLSTYFSGRGLIFDLPLSTEGFAATIDDELLTLTGRQTGAYDLFVYATDGENLLRSNEFLITVLPEITSNTTVFENGTLLLGDENTTLLLQNRWYANYFTDEQLTPDQISLLDSLDRTQAEPLLRSIANGNNRVLVKHNNDKLVSRQTIPGRAGAASVRLNAQQAQQVQQQRQNVFLDLPAKDFAVQRVTKDFALTEVNTDDFFTLLEQTPLSDIAVDEPVQALLSQALDQTQVPAVHALNVTGKGANICVIDSGFDFSSFSITPGSTFNVFDSSTNVTDVFGHGTNVLEILTSYAPDANYTLIKALNDMGSAHASDVIIAVETCMDAQADIISLSLGGGSFTGYCSADALAQTVNQAVGNGTLVIAATGNDGTAGSLPTPACAASALPVGASTFTRELASFTNYNNATLLLAPAQSLQLSSGISSGTSYAAPQIAAAAALLLEQEQSSLSPASIETRLVQTGAVLGAQGRNFSELRVLGALQDNYTNNLSRGNLLFVNGSVEDVQSLSFAVSVDGENSGLVAGNSNLTFTTSGTPDVAGSTLRNISVWKKNDMPLARVIVPFEQEKTAGQYLNDYTDYNNDVQIDPNHPASYETSNCMVGACLDLVDGSQGWAKIPHATNSSWDPDSISVSFWYYTRVPRTSPSNRKIVVKEGLSGYDEFGFGLRNSGGQKLEWAFQGSSRQIIQTDDGLASNTWYHIVGTYDSSDGAMALYLNGQLNESITASGTRSGTTTDIQIGRGTSDQHVNGIIDELYIFDVALTADEVAAIYDANSRGEHWSTIHEAVTDQGDNWTVEVTPVNRTHIGTRQSATVEIGCSLDTDCSPGESCDAGLCVAPDNYVITITKNPDGNLTQLINNVTALVPTASSLTGAVSNVTDWRVNGTSLMTLNMPFEDDRGFGEVVPDFSQHGYDGTFTSAGETPTWTTTNCIAGGCYDFDGTDDYINLTVSNDAFQQTEERGAVAFWLRPDSASTNQTLIHTEENRDRSVWLQEGALRAAMWTGSSFEVLSGPSLSLSTWHHVYFDWDRSNGTLELYVNGSSVQSYSGASWTTASSDTPSCVACSRGVDNGIPARDTFDGLLDELFIFNRTLSSEQVSSLYQEGLAGRQPLTIVGDEIRGGDNWSVVLIGVNGTDRASAVENDSVLITPYFPYEVIINGKVGNSVDLNNDINITISGDRGLTGSVSDVTDWRLEGTSIAAINLPFELDRGAPSSSVPDYTTNEDNFTTNSVDRITHTTSGCMVGGCYNFSSNNTEYIQNTGILSSQGDLTVSFWAKPTVVESNVKIVNRDSLAGYSNFGIGPRDRGSGIKWEFGYRPDGASNDVRVESTANVIAGTWYHVVGVFDTSADELRLYVNGSLVGTDTGATGVRESSTEPVRLGTSSTSISQDYEGLLDEVLIFEEVLSLAQIQSLYDAGVRGVHWDEIVSSSTSPDQNYSVQVTAVNSTDIGEIISDFALVTDSVTVSSLSIASSSGTDTSSENITVTYTVEGADANITDWRVDGTSIAVLNMPLNMNHTLTTADLVNDFSTYTNNGTLGGSTLPVWNTTCMVGGCYDFSMGASQITVDDSASLNMSGKNFTLSVWTDITSYAGQSHLLSKYSPGAYWTTGTGYALALTASPQSIWFIVSNGTAASTVNSNIGSSFGWSHLVAVRDGDTSRIYVNGSLVASDTTAVSNFDVAQDFIIGRHISFTEDYDGFIDEVAVFDRALSAEQIEQLYQDGLAGNPVQTITSDETAPDEAWSVTATAMTSKTLGNPSSSSSMTILCTQNSDCANGFFCASDQSCDAVLSDGATCDGATYAGSSTEEDGACNSGYCDNDGVGATDDGHCFTPFSIYFDNQDANYCEASASGVVASAADELQSNTCDGTSGFVTASCGYQVPDTSDTACSCGRTGSTSNGLGNFSIGGETAATECCGDDGSEFTIQSSFHAALNTTAEPADMLACCASATSCVADNTCYATGTTSSDIDGDGDTDYCSSGTWYDCSTNSQCPSGFSCSSNVCIADTGRFEIVSSSQGPAGLLDKSGLFIIEGTATASCSPSASNGDDFTIESSSGSRLLQLSANGNLCVSGTITEHQTSFPTADGDDYLVQDTSGTVVMFVEGSTGNLHLRRGLVENFNLP